MSVQELMYALRSGNDMAEYLEIREDTEIINDIKAFAEDYASVKTPQPNLRDHIAGQALIGLLVNLSELATRSKEPVTEEALAIQSYHFADAFLKVRKRGTSQEEPQDG